MKAKINTNTNKNLHSDVSSHTFLVIASLKGYLIFEIKNNINVLLYIYLIDIMIYSHHAIIIYDSTYYTSACNVSSFTYSLVDVNVLLMFN